MTAPFTDRFAAVAADYARFRPSYPEALFAWLAEQVPAHDLAWDVATGSGQAACALARYFGTVVATDASTDQIARAQPCPGVRYAVEPAERPSLADGSVDLVTVAQALHWLDRPTFFAGAERVLRPGGVLALWTYGFFHVTPTVDAVTARFYGETLEHDWAPERRLVEERYASVAFPLAPVATPAFTIEAEWTAAQVAGYVASWSAVAVHRRRTGVDPMPAFAATLAEAWGDAETHTVRWPLTVHARRKPA